MASEAALLQRLKALEEKFAELGKADEARSPNVLTLDERAAIATAGISPRHREVPQRVSLYPKVLYSVARPDGVMVNDDYAELELRETGGPWLDSPAELPAELIERFYSHQGADPVKSVRERAREAAKAGQRPPQPWMEPGPIPAPQAASGEPSGAVTRRPPGRPRKVEPPSQE